jgi:hypothetical protein
MNWFSPNRLSSGRLERHRGCLGRPHSRSIAERSEAASSPVSTKENIKVYTPWSPLSTLDARREKQQATKQESQFTIAVASSQDAVGGGQPCEMRWKASRLLLAVGTCLVLGPRPTTAQSRPGTGSTKCYDDSNNPQVSALYVDIKIIKILAK